MSDTTTDDTTGYVLTDPPVPAPVPTVADLVVTTPAPSSETVGYVLSETPNVVLSNPTVRKWAGIVLGVFGLFLTLATIVNAAIVGLHLSAYIDPAAQIWLGVSSVFGLSVTVPNVPKKV